ncbi:MAG: hypothetical protein AVDCRST_MAG69-1040, partial [uncultured Solirubrobacteraceae bacterium]
GQRSSRTQRRAASGAEPAVGRIDRDGAALQGPVRTRPDQGPHELGGSRLAGRHSRGHAHARGAQSGQDGRASAAARPAAVLPVRDRARVLRADRAPHRPQGARLHQRHGHRGRRDRQRAVRPPSRGLRGPIPDRFRGARPGV